MSKQNYEKYDCIEKGYICNTVFSLYFRFPGIILTSLMLVSTLSSDAKKIMQPRQQQQWQMFASNFAPTEPQQPPQHDQSLLVILRAHRVTAAAAAMKKFVSNFAQHKRRRSAGRGHSLFNAFCSHVRSPRFANHANHDFALVREPVREPILRLIPTDSSMHVQRT